MPPTEDTHIHCEDITPISHVQQLAHAVRTMLQNGQSINNANHVLLDPIDPYAGTPVPYLPNLRDLLRRTTGTDDLTSVTEVKLRVISRDAGLQHLSVHTPNLKELTLDGSVVSSLRDLGCRLHSLKVLKVNGCQLRCLDGLNGLRNLEKLYAANNKLTDLTPCTSIEFVRHIDVSGDYFLRNLIEDMNVVSFLVLCGTLKHLVLDRNAGLSDSPTYRADVRRFIPQLVSLDGIEYLDPPGRPHYSFPEREPEEDHEDSNLDGLSQVDPSNSDLSTSSSQTSPSNAGPSIPGSNSKTNKPNTNCYTVSFAPKVLSPRSDNTALAADPQITTRLLPKI